MNRYRFAGDRNTILRYQRKYAELFRPGETVLDVGCGEGIFLELLQKRGVRGVGIDLCVDAVYAARAKGLDVQHGDALAFVMNTVDHFDGIFMAHVIEHLAVEETETLLRRSSQVLRPGGRFIVITPNAFDIEVLTERFWLDLTHKRPYPPRLLDALAREIGLEVISIGDDPDTRQDPRGFDMQTRLRYWIYRLRFGAYFGRGDTALVARKPL